RTTFHYEMYRNTVSTSNPHLTQMIQQLTQGITAHMGLTSDLGSSVTTYLLYGMTMQQSSIEGINDAFVVATGLTVAALLLSFFLRRVKHGSMQKSK
ncbi:MAG: MFS transporter, partial [Tumebacillaceae bacterium]